MSIPCHIFLLLAVLTNSLSTMSQIPDKKQTMRFLALGDSYTIGESVEESNRWPVQLATLLRKHGYVCENPTIIATTGWRTDDLSRAIDNSGITGTYDLVSLLIGVNNQYQGKPVEDYKPEFENLLKRAISFAGNDPSKVFVVSIPDYGFTPFGKEKKDTITKEIDRFNEANRMIATRLGVKYVYITDISRRALEEPELIAEDGLHPSGKMYQEWVNRIAKELKYF
jgi:lysophospholipase L1-like esterase